MDPLKMLSTHLLKRIQQYVKELLWPLAVPRCCCYFCRRFAPENARARAEVRAVPLPESLPTGGDTLLCSRSSPTGRDTSQWVVLLVDVRRPVVHQVVHRCVVKVVCTGARYCLWCCAGVRV